MPLLPTDREKASYVQNMFQTIAPTYDLMNRLITFGRDEAWRRYIVKQAELPEKGLMLDVGAGTGRISWAALNGNPSARVIALDFSLKMMKEGKKRIQNRSLHWCQADAISLPLPDKCVDAVTSGYLLRNVTDVRNALREQQRVLRPGGRVVCLETTPPGGKLLKPFILLHMNLIIPLLGKLIAGNSTAYRYLPNSTQAFMGPEDLTRIMRETGFEDVTFKRFMFNTQMVCSGRRTGEGF